MISKTFGKSLLIRLMNNTFIKYWTNFNIIQKHMLTSIKIYEIFLFLI